MVGESTTIAAEFLSRVAIIIERSRLRSQEVKTKEVCKGYGVVGVAEERDTRSGY